MQARGSFVFQARRFLLFIVVISIIFPYLVPASSMGHTSGQVRSQLNADKARLQETKDAKDHVENEIRQADAQMASIATSIESLESDLRITRGKIDSTVEEIARLEREYQLKQEELVKAKREVARLKRVLNKRAKNAYQAGEVSILEVVLKARTFGELLHKLNFIEKIVDYDAQLVAEMKETKIRVQTARRQIEANREAAKQSRDALALQKERLEGLVSDRRKQKAALEAETAEKREVMEQLGSREKQIEAQIAAEEADARALEQLERQGGLSGGYSYAGPPSPGGYIWPAQGSVTSPFGDGRNHQGIDIANATGTPIFASKAGVVVYSGWMSGYGNVIDVDHGGGVKTRYAHNSANLVSAGQSVAQGQQIASMGSTGRSTGPHVHFEIRVNGSAVDPMGYLP